MSGARTRLRRALVVLAALFLVWAPLVVLTGGFGFRLGALSISSRRPRNALVIALLLAALAWALAPGGRRLGTLGEDLWRLAIALRMWLLRAWRGWIDVETRLMADAGPRAAAAAAGAIAVLIVIVGFREGAFVAAASDAWGYVSEAERWAHGTLHVDQPLMRELTPRVPAEALAPLAYRPSVDRSTIVPVVAPGLPLLMAAFQVVGGRDAVFFVVPLLAGVAIGATFLLGTRMAGPWSGVAAAALLAASPSFLFQLTSSPMSDIPATAWWALSLALALGENRRAALASGVAAGAAILTRSNLAPLAILPALLLLSSRWRGTSSTGRAGLRFVLFAAGVVPACLFIAWLNTSWYGSPLSSGYGSLEQIYGWQHVWPNLERYPRWLIESQTPVILLAFVAPWLSKRRLDATLLLAFAVTVLACYLVYFPFDAWWFLRFLLPAYPPLLALSASVVVRVAGRFPAGLRLVVGTLTALVVAWHGVTYATAQATFTSEGEMKYAVAGRYVAEHLPERAVLLAIQHSGSARYYSGRVTIRWDWIPPESLAWMLDEVRRQGYVPYALVEDWEVPTIQERFRGQPALTSFERPPLVELPLGHVRIYALD